MCGRIRASRTKMRREWKEGKGEHSLDYLSLSTQISSKMKWNIFVMCEHINIIVICKLRRVLYSILFCLFFACIRSRRIPKNHNFLPSNFGIFQNSWNSSKKFVCIEITNWHDFTFNVHWNDFWTLFSRLHAQKFDSHWLLTLHEGVGWGEKGLEKSGKTFCRSVALFATVVVFSWKSEPWRVGKCRKFVRYCSDSSSLSSLIG